MKGVTIDADVDVLFGENFNPHTREGCDFGSAYTTPPTIEISIHTPVKGVTPGSPESFTIRGISIHTPVKGVTTYRIPVHNRTLFQSTHP